MPSVVGKMTKGAVFDWIVDAGSVGDTGTIAIDYGGTGQTTAQAAIDALTQVSGATNEHVLTKDTATGNAVFKVATGGSGISEELAIAYAVSL